jgi:stress response protein SCP2
MSASELIPVERVNGRLPTLKFGLAWDTLGLDPKVAQQKTGFPPDVLAQTGADSDQANVLLRPAGDQADLDAVVFWLKDGVPVDYISGQRGSALDGALGHSGDDKTGAGGGWDEVVLMQLNLLPPEINALAVMLKTAYKQPLQQVPNVRASLFYAQGERPLLTLDRRFDHKETSLVFAMLLRRGPDFVVRPVMHGYEGFDPLSMEPVLRRFL